MKIEKWIADALVHCLEEGQPPAERYGQQSVPFADRYYKLEFSSRNERRNRALHDQLTFPLRGS
ncbi:MAG: hypothetical protein IIA14_15995 [SAR324 cluster bacterium]|nr:hypothetical protein [SAR324 cluster bacterium]